MPHAEQAAVFLQEDGAYKALPSEKEDDLDSIASTELVQSMDSQAFSSEGESSDAADVADVFPAPCLPSETLIFFDWDDTLMPTSWVQHLCPSPDSEVDGEEDIESLHRVATGAKALLEAAKASGTVVIVTNGKKGWVEFCCQRFLPGLLPALQGVKIVSARTAYEKVGVWDPCTWKVKAFQAEADAFRGISDASRSHPPTNLISIGDSMHEQEALFKLAKGIPQCRAKSVKLMEKPRPQQLEDEHDLLLQNLDQVISHDGNLDFAVGPQ